MSKVNRIKKFNDYNAKDIEDKWYKYWESHDLFKPIDSTETFCIMLPPPNITGNLHIGHALTNSIQDAIIRYHRMNGRETLWLPGTDHAGIATQAIVERKLWQEKSLTRHDLGREEFVNLIWQWKNQYGGNITNQLKRMGSSLDWSREKFTLDCGMYEAVQEAFVRLYETGKISRQTKMINWSCALRSVISDVETDSMKLNGKTEINIPGYDEKVTFGLTYHLKFKLDQANYIAIPTTRPEYLYAVTGIITSAIVNQDVAIHPLTNKEIPIIRMEGVDRCLIPGHDLEDFTLAQKHHLGIITVLSDEGNLNDNCGQHSNMKRFMARKEIIKFLNQYNLIEKVTKSSMEIKVCSRSGDVIEGLIKPQWFLDCREMAQKAKNAEISGQLNIYPEKYRAEYHRWLDNTTDWCISRQLWWGHRVPAYQYKLEDDLEYRNDWIIARNVKEAVIKASTILNVSEEKISIKQDDDVLDTWFSSGLYPFSTLGWPQKTPEYMKYYPNNLLETGYDILYFWVARMVMLGIELTGVCPFKDVLIHALVRDASGKKMSKSSGNVIDPIDIIDGCTLDKLIDQVNISNLSDKDKLSAIKLQTNTYPKGLPECGTDALRFVLCEYANAEISINLDIKKIISGRKFANKLWHVCYFILDVLKANNNHPEPATALMNKWIVSKINSVVSKVHEAFKTYKLNKATTEIYAYWWFDFCDVYIESIKNNVDYDIKATLKYCFINGLKLLHPFMPFITEELYQKLISQPLINSKFPQPDIVNLEIQSDVNKMLKITNKLRIIKKERGNGLFVLKVEPNLKPYIPIIKKLAKISELKEEPSTAELTFAEDGYEIYFSSF